MCNLVLEPIGTSGCLAQTVILCKTGNQVVEGQGCGAANTTGSSERRRNARLTSDRSQTTKQLLIAMVCCGLRVGM
jgi:hypothetical protein